MSKAAQKLLKLETKKNKRPRNNAMFAVAPAIVESYSGGKYGEADVNLLMEILRLRRPHDSITERKFSINFLDRSCQCIVTSCCTRNYNCRQQ